MELDALDLDGYGYGDGSGSGYGYGDGSGLKKRYLEFVLAEFQTAGAVTCFWRSNGDGTPANGGSGTIAKEGLREEIAGPLKICTKNALHGTFNPSKYKGGRWWIVALHEPVQCDEDKRGALKRTILKDLGKCPF